MLKEIRDCFGDQMFERTIARNSIAHPRSRNILPRPARRVGHVMSGRWMCGTGDAGCKRRRVTTDSDCRPQKSGLKNRRGQRNYSQRLLHRNRSLSPSLMQ